MVPGYSPRKAAQAAAFFAIKDGGKINVLKLSKLLYLAERESMRLYDEPMFFDTFVSMDHGPVASISLNLINGDTEASQWSEFVADRSGHDVPLPAAAPRLEDLDELSRADLKILNDLWDRFGSYNGYRLRDYTHKHCAEWEHPGGTSVKIDYVTVFQALKKEDPDALAEEVRKHRALARAIAG